MKASVKEVSLNECNYKLPNIDVPSVVDEIMSIINDQKYKEINNSLKEDTKNIVSLGEKVTLMINGEEKIYTIGWENDTEIDQISYRSPIIQSVIGYGKNFRTTLKLPDRTYYIKVLDVK